jgi:hypothetical protein
MSAAVSMISSVRQDRRLSHGCSLVTAILKEYFRFLRSASEILFSDCAVFDQLTVG